MKRAAFLLLSLAWCAHARAEGLALSAQTRIAPSTMTVVAEKARAEAIVTSNRKIALSSFTVAETENLHILGTAISEPEPAENGQWRARVTVDFMPLAEGESEFPSLSVPYRAEDGHIGTLQTPPARFFATAGKDVAPMGEPLRDIKGPARADLWPLILGLLGLAGALGAGIWIYRQGRKSMPVETAPAEPPRPAWDVALEALDRLWAEHDEMNDANVFYTGLSMIFRTYLSGRFQLDAVERTTTEISADMRARSMDRAVQMNVKEILSACDLVKFAKLAPAPEQAREDWSRVRRFVEETRLEESAKSLETQS